MVCTNFLSIPSDDIWCKLQRGEQVFKFGLISWPQYLNNKCEVCARFQSVRFMTPIEL